MYSVHRVSSMIFFNDYYAFELHYSAELQQSTTRNTSLNSDNSHNFELNFER